MSRHTAAFRVAALGAAMLITACSTAAGEGSPSTPRAGPRPSTARAGPRPTAAPPGYRYLTDLSGGTQARRYGFNLVDLGPYRPLIDALPAGERALVWLGGYNAADCAFFAPDGEVRQQLPVLAGDPKVAGFYIADEADDALPAYGGHCPHVAAQVTARSALVHQLAPRTFTYEVVTEPGNFAAFARAADVLGTDPYPCLVGRQCDWSLIPKYIAALDAAHVARYWGVLQAFSYGQWREPTQAELARMIGQWQHSRWQGEQVFSWRYEGWSLAIHSGLLAELRAVNVRGLVVPRRAPGVSHPPEVLSPAGRTPGGRRHDRGLLPVNNAVNNPRSWNSPPRRAGAGDAGGEFGASGPGAYPFCPDTGNCSPPAAVTYPDIRDSRPGRPGVCPWFLSL